MGGITHHVSEKVNALFGVEIPDRGDWLKVQALRAAVDSSAKSDVDGVLERARRYEDYLRGVE